MKNPVVNTLGILTALWAPATLWAQAVTAGGGDTLEEVVVTAEKRSEDVQKTPIALTALTSKDLEEKGIQKLEDLANTAPGVTISNTGIIKLINIRGIGLALISPNTSSGIINYRDGVLITHEPFLVDAYFDMDRIEILRGPQGTLAGSNSTGGAVLVVTKNPDLGGKVDGFVAQTVGEYNDLRTEAALNLPINDQWAARIAMNSETRDSYWEAVANPGATAVASNNVPGALDQRAVRLSLYGKPLDNFTISLKTEYNINRGTGIAQQPTPFSAYYSYASHVPFVLDYDYQNSLSRNQDSRTILQLDWQVLPNAEIRSQTAYSSGTNRENDDSDASAFNGQIQTFFVGFKTVQQELDLLSTGSGPLQYTAGAFLLHDIVDNYSFSLLNYGTPGAVIPGGGVNIQPFGTQKAFDVAGFGQMTYDLNDQLQVLGGIRYTENHRWAPDSGVTISPPGIQIYNVGDYKRGVTTGKLGLNWNANPNNLVYAFAARGAKSGGYNTGAVGTSLFGPESVWDYELGWKSTLLDQHLRTQIDGFYENYNGFQLNEYNPITESSIVANAAQAKIKGFEAQVQGQFAGLGLDASAAYVDSSLGSSVLYDTRYTPAIPFNVDGHSLPYAAKWTANAGVQYALPVGQGSLTPRVQWSYVGSEWTTPYQVAIGAYIPERDHIPAHSLVDARVTWVPSATWQFEAYGKNLANKVYIQSINSQSTTDADVLGDPRTFGITGRYNF